MTIDDFKRMYGRSKVVGDIVDQDESTYRNLEASESLEQILEEAAGERLNLREDSAKTRQAIAAQRIYIRQQKDILDYTKGNIDGILHDSEKKNVIRAASLGVKNYKENDESELAQYLTAYRLVELLKVEEDTEDKNDRSRKRKRRLTGEQRGKLVDGVLPLIVKEKLRANGTVPEKDLEFYASTIAYVAALSDRSYVANAMNEGQELLGKRIESIGGAEDYVISNLREDKDYLSFASSLGEAYELSEAD